MALRLHVYIYVGADMIVRIQLPLGQPIQRKQGKNRDAALAAATLLQPLCLMAYVLGFWRLLADLGFAGQFAISNSIFSHWQVWIPVAVLLQIAAATLGRYGQGGPLAIPRWNLFQLAGRPGKHTRAA